MKILWLFSVVHMMRPSFSKSSSVFLISSLKAEDNLVTLIMSTTNPDLLICHPVFGMSAPFADHSLVALFGEDPSPTTQRSPFLYMIRSGNVKCLKNPGGWGGLGAYQFRVWFGLGFQIFLEITSQGMTYHIQKYRVVLFGTWWNWVSIGQYWLVLGGTGSLKGNAGRY